MGAGTITAAVKSDETAAVMALFRQPNDEEKSKASAVGVPTLAEYLRERKAKRQRNSGDQS